MSLSYQNFEKPFSGRYCGLHLIFIATSLAYRLAFGNKGSQALSPLGLTHLLPIALPSLTQISVE